MHDKQRKLGLVKNDILDTSYFDDILKKYKVQIGDGRDVHLPGHDPGDRRPGSRTAQAPTAIARS